jgi:purine-nucleoside phosphorylase
MADVADLHTRLAYALAFVRGHINESPHVGVILGSGLGAFADGLETRVEMKYETIPEFPVSKVPGHAGKLVVGRIGGTVVAAMSGRVHGYEGWPPAEVAFGARVLCALGVKALVVTNAAGGINPSYTPGDLVRITDHLNLSGQNPLSGENDDRIGPRFPDLSHAYDGRLALALDDCAKKMGLIVKSGIYACLGGPSYETPAEIKMLRILGADLVGMSTVPEVIAARHMGVPVCGISVVTNYAAGIATRPLSHDEVKETADRVRERFTGLLKAFLPRAAGF